MEIVDQLLGLGSNFYWMLAGSLVVGLVLLAYVWREFAGWFFKVHEVLREVRGLKDEVALLRAQISGRGTDSASTPSPRVPYSPATQSLDLVSNSKAPLFPTDHRAPAPEGSTSGDTFVMPPSHKQETAGPQKHQFTLR
ncbi:MAG: hypothetical protein K2X47_09420 [Bdellovibrionales bacterium]|nr:hypothetical protein [Bdellovibrionales bacterium]